MKTLILHVGHFYLNIAGQIIGLVREVPMNSPFYEQDGRFIDQNGSIYTDAGRHFDEPGIDLVHEVLKSEVDDHALVSAVEAEIESYHDADRPMIELNTYYRNQRGDLVLICNEIDHRSLAYKAGFRFVDHKNRQYTAYGVMSTWFPTMNLVNLTDPITDIPQAEFDEIEAALVKMSTRRDRFRVVARAVDPYLDGAMYGTYFVATYRVGALIGGVVTNRLLSLAA